MSNNPRNPFIHKVALTPLQKVSMCVCGVTLLPIRALVALVCLTLATSLAYIGLYNLTTEELEGKPFTHWRLYIRKAICCILRFMFFVCGFHRVRIQGEQASPSVAKILAVAPHSTFFDALAVVVMGAPSVVAKAETSNVPFWGSLIKYTQPVLVHRNDPNSRQNTIKQIVERSEPTGDWQQVLIFPEGTCTNRSCLITFRPGAFVPGVAVQPVAIRYDNQPDTVTWTWEGLPAWKVLVYTLTQFNLNCTIEYLEPYVPDRAEIHDSKLFAENVRKVMADTLKIPTTDCNYFDYLRIEKSQTRAKKLQKLQRKLEEPLIQTTEYLQTTDESSSSSSTSAPLAATGSGDAARPDDPDAAATNEEAAAVADLAARLGTSPRLGELTAVLEDFNRDLRQFRLAVLLAMSDNALQAFLHNSFTLFDRSLGDEEVSKDTIKRLLRVQFFLSDKEAGEACEGLCVNGVVTKSQLRDFITSTKPHYLKVIRAMEGQLSGSMTDLFAKSASLTAEIMAARLEKVAASGSSLVSDVSASVAAGRDKVTDALSSAVTSLHKRTDSYSDKKKN